jgi:hypothetical protein
MASIMQIQALKKSLIEQINTAFAPLLTEAADAAGDDAAEPEEPKLTPHQKLEKQLETANDKLTKLNEKIAGGKSKIPDKDAENKTKLEEIVSNLNGKISETKAKEAKKAEPKPAKAAAKKPVKAAEEAEKPAPAVAEAKAEKHVPSMSRAMTILLKKAAESTSVPWDTKYSGEFLTWVNSLSDDEFASGGTLEVHMAKFINQYRPASAGGGACAAMCPPVKTWTLDELAKQYKKDNLKQMSPGVFQDKTTGDMVTGPEENSDEEFGEYLFDNETYMIGEDTGRVYKPDDTGDVFVGFQHKAGTKITNIGNW